MMRRALRLTAVMAGVALAAAACGSSGNNEAPESNASPTSTPTGTAGGAALPDLKGQTVEVAAVWTGDEQKNFLKVVKPFEEQTGATIKYTSTGDQIASVLTPRVKGGSPPDVAFLPQPGLMKQFVESKALKPVSNEVSSAVDANYSPVWKDLGTVDGKLYGVWFKASNKSTVWYNVHSFEDAGVQPPKTWDEFIDTAKTLSAAGQQAVSIGGADGWTLTDWFENVYLSQAGPQMYDKLTAHEIKWTDDSVKKALETLAQLWGNPELLAGGTTGALQTDFPTSVTKVFSDPPQAAMVYEGDFVAGVITSSTKAKLGTDAKFFPFPMVGDKPAVVGGGDVAVAFKDNPGAMALLQYLATPQAAEIWVKAGGFTSPNKNVSLDAYPDEISRQIAKALIDAGDSFRFDMSDQAPSAFGGTKGAGMWKDLADFLRNPKDVQGAMNALEADASQAYGN
ncbi:MAG: extracellular solute-binding protein [Intrasporangium sp.]|uniref:ABC transporter substrate-binding protein n=1 Tax=Intrasporangium sp. TaxID=1925024 RepID=UPI00264A4AAD|nr:extracellular solute-binding protein [Intrasporangium sp.]MDN5794972.1 extracellular solute-binding protein [Intrasporangium sp.]